MRSGGNRNSVTLSRMIKARFSRFVCPVATYVSYFSFTSCQCSGVLFLHDAQRFRLWTVWVLKPRLCQPIRMFIKLQNTHFLRSAHIGYSLVVNESSLSVGSFLH